MEKIKVIAYYLPQFHTIPENDEWWGEGFTEWVNVKKAKPLFDGHKQPNVPTEELGYYNLLDDEVRRKQGRLAKEAGIDAFCYWHYWFGDGKELLEAPFKKTLADKLNGFEFCLGWANESWKRKQWAKDGIGDVTLIEQKYPGYSDDEAHFMAYLEAFKDNRYVRINGKPVFLIYRPYDHPDIKEFINTWNKLARENGIEKGFCFIAELGLYYSVKSIDYLKNQGFDYVTYERANMGQAPVLRRFFYTLKNYFLGRPKRVIDYSNFISWAYTKKDNKLEVIPGICPTWDHSPRSGSRCSILHGSSPILFAKLLENTLRINKEGANLPILFIKSWNEWGEGNYIEPDTKWGKSYIEEMGKVLKSNM